jgi:predicted MFS family arabinose efflux permease
MPTERTTHDAPQRAPRILLFVLMAAMAVGVMFNFGVTSLSAPLIESFGITDGQFGLILSTIFLSAGLTATVLGVLADRLSTVMQMALIMLGTLAAFVLTIFWHTFAGVLVAALLVGPAQALSNPVTNRLIATRVPKAQRSAWMGWKQSGVQMGMLVAGLTFPLIASVGGWTLAGTVGAAVCAACFGVAFAVLRRRSGRGAGPRTGAVQLPGRGDKLPGAVWIFTAISFLNAVGTQGVNAYVSLFSVREFGFPVEIGGLVIGVIGVIGIASRVGWGRVNGGWGRPAPLISIMSLGGVVGLVALSLASVTGQVCLLWLGIAMHAALPLAANVVINSGIIMAAPAARIGIASGLVSAGMYLGFALGPALVGQLIDLTGTFQASWAAAAGTYVLCFLLALLLSYLQRGPRAPLN